jgi:hypothetical protein
MKFKVLILILALATVGFGRNDLVKIRIPNRNQAVTLERMGLIIDQVTDDAAIAEVNVELIPEMRKTGYQIEVLTEGIDEIYRKNFEESRGRYLTYAEYVDTMRIIAQNNPDICRLDTLGTTATGYLVLGMKVSDSAWLNQPEPRALFEGDIHGDEKCGWSVCFEMIKYLVNNYAGNPAVRRLVDTREIWIVPMTNPYGYVNSVRTNSNGVDLNRNWGYMWRNTSGSAPFSEAETRSLKKSFDRDAFTTWLSFHGGSMVTLYQWGYTTDIPPDSAEVSALAAIYAVATGNYYGSIMNEMYYAPGNSIDHLYGSEGVAAIASEISYTKTPPANQLDALFNTNRDPMLNLMRCAKWGVEGVVTDSASGQPLPKAMLEPITPTKWLSYADSPGGDYHRFLRPGTYSIRFSANGYQSKTVTGVSVPTDSSVLLNVGLLPNPTQNTGAWKCVVCNVTDPNQAYANHSLAFWSLGLRDDRRLSIGVRGWVDFDMGMTILNGSGNDFTVVEGDADAEICTVFVANAWNGPWTRVGVANGTTSFDLQSVGLSQTRYIRLKDDGDGSANGATAGFDVDAVEGFFPATGMAEVGSTGPILTEFSAGPNPTRSGVNIRFMIHDPGCMNKNISLNIYDITGRLVKSFPRLQSLIPNPSALTWDGSDQAGRKVSAGVYYAVLRAGPERQCRKIILIE